ncbi:hypothetical protein Bca52824_018146 [Brassica carinata]|uniref:SET domain-containing protein n=1 Tax=Brassica carinata TaxID=52824 RepID=A0A8X8AW46_BRACI|nr:hypothetical protein Bca52824_018146 [Brassica carinata]
MSGSFEFQGLPVTWATMERKNMRGHEDACYSRWSQLRKSDIYGLTDVPVADGSSEPLKGDIPRVADFLHETGGPKPRFHVVLSRNVPVGEEVCGTYEENVEPKHRKDLRSVHLGVLRM